MLTWDLSDTPLARSNDLVPAPNEAELFTLLAALLLTEGISYSQLARTPVQLTEGNRWQVAEIVEWCLSPLSADIGSGRQLRERLRTLEGAVVMLVPQQRATVVAGKERA